jgi:hypothetical protein
MTVMLVRFKRFVCGCIEPHSCEVHVCPIELLTGQDDVIVQCEVCHVEAAKLPESEKKQRWYCCPRCSYYECGMCHEGTQSRVVTGTSCDVRATKR